MTESWIEKCSELAPYLKEKLAVDKKHTWRDAPYIHEDVRAALAEHEPQPTYVRPESSNPCYRPHLGYVPPTISTKSFYNPYYSPATSCINAMMPIRAGTEINMGISAQVDSLDAQLRQAERNLCINQQLLQNEILLGMMNANRDIWGF